MQFFGEIWQNHMLVVPGRVGAPTSGKFWISHWLVFLYIRDLNWNFFKASTPRISCSGKKLTSNGGVEPTTLGLLTWQVFTEGYLSSVFLMQLMIWLKSIEHGYVRTFEVSVFQVMGIDTVGKA